MKIIGITGGVGSGKSTVLTLLQEMTKCVIIMADDVAKQTTAVGGAAYEPVVALLGRDILEADGSIDRRKMAAAIFTDEARRRQVNEIIHPVTKDMIKRLLAAAQRSGEYDYAFVEAALLIEAGYQDVCSEFWYIYVPADIRIRRLMESRGYTEQKCRDIMANQLPEEEFFRHCAVTVDNSGTPEETRRRLEELLEKENQISEERP